MQELQGPSVDRVPGPSQCKILSRKDKIMGIHEFIGFSCREICVMRCDKITEEKESIHEVQGCLPLVEEDIMTETCAVGRSHWTFG